MSVILTKRQDFRVELRALTNLLRQCVGPQGKLQLLTSTTSHSTLTSMSSRLTPELRLNTSHPVLTCLLQAAQAQNERFKDGGLWTCICAGLLLDSVIVHRTPELTFDLCRQGLDLLNSSAVRVEITLDSVRPLLMVAQSVLRSKPSAFGPACSDVMSVSLAVVKAFVETSGSIQSLIVQGEAGLAEPRLLPGLLVKCTEDELSLVRGNNWENASVVLITSMLTDVKDPLEKVEDGVEIKGDSERKIASSCRVVQLATKAGIRIVACQRVVHPQAVLLARRSGVLILPRLGRQMTARFEAISGTKPLSGDPSDITVDMILKGRGRLQNLHHEVVGNHEFLALDGDVHTLLLHAPTSECSAELSAVVNQSLAALMCAVSDSGVLPGAGCLETWLCAQLWGKVSAESNQSKRPQLLSVLKDVQLAVLSAAGLDTRKGTLSVDSETHHSWDCPAPYCDRMSAGMRCRCRLVIVSSLSSSVRWTVVDELCSEPPIKIWGQTSLKTRLKLPQELCDVVLDALSVKRNALRVAVEMASTLASIGATLLPSEA